VKAARNIILIMLLLVQAGCISRWMKSPPVENSPRTPTVIGKGDFKAIDKDNDGVISKEEFVDEKEKAVNSENATYLWVFLGIASAVVGACCLPFVYTFASKNMSLQFAKDRMRKHKEDRDGTNS
jgi:hypothetical protein